LGFTPEMINQSDNPVPWALLLYEIDEVREHLDSLAKQMAADGRIDDEDFAVQIGHAYAHLNRIWHRRNDEAEEIADDKWDALSKFPTDIDPVG
jgi:hypothetical protein